MVTGSSPAKQKAGQELVITRVFNAPREFVWKAWTDPKCVLRWWGLKDFMAQVCIIDFRVGGVYLYNMHSFFGDDFWNTGVFREIVPLERIVYTDSFSDEMGKVVPASYYGMKGDRPLELQVTVTFEEQDGKTKFTLRYAGIPAGESRNWAETGWNETLDKLAEVLEESTDES
jgi:uncharacterized protein YndB with AHSA1/START domain